MLLQVAAVQKYKQVEGGAVFQIFVPEYEPTQKLSAKCEIRFDDGRYISSGQRKLLYALFREICLWSGHEISEIKDFMKIEFMIDCDRDYFSLSNIDMRNAKDFIEYVLAFIFHHGVPMKRKVQMLAKEVNNYLYLCLVNQACAECGGRADIHHIDAIGMGRDRTKMDHTKHRLIALCREHHEEAHRSGWTMFKEKYHLEGIKVNEETVKKLKL